MLTYEKFISKSAYPRNECERALALHYEHPKLMQRLSVLAADGCKITSVRECPWGKEVKALNITLRDVEIITSYFEFAEQEEAKRMRKYWRASGFVKA